jgi:hypothetical protein
MDAALRGERATYASVFGLAGTIQLNHEWTRMITNENALISMTAFDSPNGDQRMESGQRPPGAPAIRVNSCPFVVSYCMDTA